MFTYESLEPELLGMEILNPVYEFPGLVTRDAFRSTRFSCLGCVYQAEKFWVYKLWSSANQFVRW